MEKGLENFGVDACERVEKAIWKMKQGKGIVIVDDEDRENEGDLIFPAESMSVSNMAFMIRETSGIVCVCLLKERADELGLNFMVQENTSRFQTPFTVSVDAAEGITTGVSAADRITTIHALAADDSRPENLSKPGHIFPLIAKNGGVLERNGHTEASVDMMLLAGLKPLAVLCELMHSDGTMRRLPEITDFARQCNLTVVSIKDIQYYRRFVRDYSVKNEESASTIH